MQPQLHEASRWSLSSLPVGAAGLTDTHLSKQPPLHTAWFHGLWNNCFRQAVHHLQHPSEVRTELEQAGTSPGSMKLSEPCSDQAANSLCRLRLPPGQFLTHLCMHHSAASEGWPRCQRLFYKGRHALCRWAAAEVLDHLGPGLMLHCLSKLVYAFRGQVCNFDWLRQRHTIVYEDGDMEVIPLWSPMQMVGRA